MAYNSVTVEGALALLTVVKKASQTALEEINICVSFRSCYCHFTSMKISILCFVCVCVNSTIKVDISGQTECPCQ